MIDAGEKLGCVCSQAASPRIHQHAVPARVDEQQGIGCGDLSRRQLAPAKALLDMLPGYVGEQALERIVEGTIADAHSAESPQLEAKASGGHRYLLFTVCGRPKVKLSNWRPRCNVCTPGRLSPARPRWAPSPETRSDRLQDRDVSVRMRPPLPTTKGRDTPGRAGGFLPNLRDEREPQRARALGRDQGAARRAAPSPRSGLPRGVRVVELRLRATRDGGLSGGWRGSLRALAPVGQLVSQGPRARLLRGARADARRGAVRGGRVLSGGAPLLLSGRGAPCVERGRVPH